MLNKCFKTAPCLMKFLLFIILFFIIFIAKSFDLIIFLSIMLLYVSILNDYNVNEYLKCIRKYSILLFFITIIYIIVMGIKIEIILFIYRWFLLCLLFDLFMFMSTTFEIYFSISYILFNKNEKASLNFTTLIVCIYLFFEEFYRITKCRHNYGKIRNDIKTFFQTLVFIQYKKSIIKEFLYLKKNIFVKKSFSFNHYFILLLFIFFLIITIYKEVIL